MHAFGVLLVLDIHLVDIVRILALQEVVIGIGCIEESALEATLRL